MKRLRRAVRDYLTMRRGLGFKMARHEVCLQDFVAFLERNGLCPLPCSTRRSMHRLSISEG